MKPKSGKANVSPVLWGVFLWIIVPVGLFFAGYKLVGPKIGEVPALKKPVEDLIATAGPKDEKPTQKDPEVVDDPNGPSVEVTVEKATRGSSRRTSDNGDPKPKKKKKKPVAKPVNKPARDEASGDGAMNFSEKGASLFSEKGAVEPS